MHTKARFGANILLAFAAYALPTLARSVAEAPPRPVGIVEQPCPVVAASSASMGASSASVAASPAPKEAQERLLDPNAHVDAESPDPTAVAASHAIDEDRLHNDWAFLCRYRVENASLRHPTAPRIVFIGDSITELWRVAHPYFFGDNYVDRGVSGQTTAQMVVRFRQDVIALKPAVVHIMAGTNDFAGNGGPITLEAVKNNIASMVDLAIANDVRVVLASVPPAGAFPWRPTVVEPAQHIVEFNDWLRRFARERGLIYVDYHEPLADERDAMKQTFSNDGVHPNRDGYSVMEPLAHRAIEQALASSNDAGNRTPAPKAVKGRDLTDKR
jgi:lysophospholipase L1-like esterase